MAFCFSFPFPFTHSRIQAPLLWPWSHRRRILLNVPGGGLLPGTCVPGRFGSPRGVAAKSPQAPGPDTGSRACQEALGVLGILGVLEDVALDRDKRGFLGIPQSVGEGSSSMGSGSISDDWRSCRGMALNCTSMHIVHVLHTHYEQKHANMWKAPPISPSKPPSTGGGSRPRGWPLSWAFSSSIFAFEASTKDGVNGLNLGSSPHFIQTKGRYHSIQIHVAGGRCSTVCAEQAKTRSQGMGGVQRPSGHAPHTSEKAARLRFS